MHIYLALGSLFIAAASAVALEVRDGRCGTSYRGLYLDEVETFLSIPYAHSTAGQNRFKPPRPYIPASGTTFDATRRGPACPQALGAQSAPLYLGNITETSEDCLHLNVYRPNGTQPDDKLPVLVHIHGGSFVLGSKDEITIQPGGLILESIANGHPVMQVNVNYRLGVFGFAKSDSLTSEGSANAGLKDQRAAIEWVKEHIEAFGGDPEKITIFGQSSGGLAIGLQMMAYGASKPFPFHQAICESQTLEPGITGNYTRDAMQRVAKAAGCDTTPLESSVTISCLRNMTTDQLLTAQLDTYASDSSANLGDIWLPAVDGDFLPEAPSTLIDQGRFANVTTMMGWCDEDVQPFVPRSIDTVNDTHSFLQDYGPGLSQANMQHLLSLYPSAEFQANPSANLSAEFYRSTRMLRDILMVCEPYYYGQAITSKKGRDVYFYDQNQTVLGPILDYVNETGYGVVHTAEFAYVFGNISHYNIYDYPYHPNASDFALAKRESRSWSTFATFGYPSLEGHDTLSGWTPAFAGGDNITDVYVIGGPREGLSPDVGPGANAVLASQKLKERCDFINRPDVIKQFHF